MIVVDTNVASELMRPSPNAAVREWVRSRSERDLYTTSITVAEIRYGIERLPHGHRKERLQEAAEEVFTAFDVQILPFDAAATPWYAAIVSHRDSVGRPIDGFDAQIASICRVHGAVLATRNVTDFRDIGVTLVDPWNNS